MSEEKYYYAGRWCGEPIYLEEGMKMDLGTKIPLFLMKILPKKLGFAKGEVNEK